MCIWLDAKRQVQMQSEVQGTDRAQVRWTARDAGHKRRRQAQLADRSAAVRG